MNTTPNTKDTVSSWKIALCFALWFLIIPPIIGAVLVSKQKKQLDAYAEPLKNVEKLREEADAYKEKTVREADEISGTITEKQHTVEALNAEIAQKQSEIYDLDDQILFQSFALYKPRFAFTTSDEYKNRLADVRQRQKDMIKNETAINSSDIGWTVNNSRSEGKKMMRDVQKLILRAYNTECDSVVEHVTYSNIATSEKRIRAAEESISKLGRVFNFSISPTYAVAKLEELYLAFEYQQMKQKEKEEQKELRAQMREEAKLQREIEEERKKAEKEQKHYKNALATLNERIATASGEELRDLEAKKAEIEEHLSEIDKNMAEIDYRQANAKAGYVYVISNIGAFGENVYKIGMTRRLDPQERIDELGDASVPFDFDVHAMIFSDNAPALEAALHKAFEDRKLNMINTRREFFNVSLQEIKDVVKANFDKSVEFIEIAPAEQYRESLAMKRMM